jgi:hypothetical protein
MACRLPPSSISTVGRLPDEHIFDRVIPATQSLNPRTAIRRIAEPSCVDLDNEDAAGIDLHELNAGAVTLRGIYLLALSLLQNVDITEGWGPPLCS